MPQTSDATSERPALDPAKANAILKGIAAGFRDQVRAPILKTPADVGLAFDNVTFASEDGVPLEGWFVPKPGSTRLVIANHPRGFNRYGSPSHLEPWRSFGAIGGNDFEVDFTLDLGILHDAGYNVLTYDLRNHGHSGAANGGLITSGRFESRDVVGSLEFVRDQVEFRDMTVGLFSRCLGCNSTIFAMERRPDVFADVRCMVGVQPLSVRAIMSGMLDLIGVGAHRIEDLAEEIRIVTSFPIDQLSPLEAARHVGVPTLVYQVRDDVMTRASDVQSIFDAIGSSRKELFWIEGTTRRWDGYTYFARHPERIVDWFDDHMAG